MGIFKKKRDIVLQPAISEENPVNYTSVLDYLVGLSEEEYEKISKVTGIYRSANRKAAGILEVDDQPTTTLKEEKPSDDQIEIALDDALTSDDYEPTDDEPEVAKPKKPQAPSPEKKIDVKQL